MQTLHYNLAFLEAVLSNPNLYLEPYLQQLLPTILTSLLSVSFSSHTVSTPEELDDEFIVRRHAGSLLSSLLSKYSASYPTLRSRVLKTLLRALLEKRQSSSSASGAGSRWGAVLTLRSMGSEPTRALLAANVVPIGDALAADERAGDALRVDKVVAEATVRSSLSLPGVRELTESSSPSLRTWRPTRGRFLPKNHWKKKSGRPLLPD